MRVVHWNKLAKQDYFANIDFLLKEWSVTQAQNFINEVYEIEFILKQGNIDFQDTNRHGIKRCVLNRHITLFYKIIDEHNIELLRFWNNSRDINQITL